MKVVGLVARRFGLLIVCGVVGVIVGGVSGEVIGVVTRQTGFWLVGAEIGGIGGVVIGATRFR